MNDIEYNIKTFESIKHIDENGREFWYARELMLALEYTKWSNFNLIINKAKNACISSNMAVLDHFADVGKMVEIGAGAKRKQKDYKLSRYACYLIAQNGDSRKRKYCSCSNLFCYANAKART